MKTKLRKISKISILAMLVALMGISSTVYNADLSGSDIAKRAKYNNRSQKMVSKAVMVLQSYSGGQWKTLDTRNLYMQSMIWSGSGFNSLTRTISRFMTGLKKGVTFLSIEVAGGSDDIQYSFLPSLGRPRRVSSSEKQNDFEDTDVTNEEMGSPKIENYTYRRLPDENYRGIPCYVVERFPKDRSIAKYSRHKSWITKQHFVPIKVEAYDMEKRLKKKIYARNIKRFGKIYITMNLRVINVQKNTRTLLMIKDVFVDGQAPVNRSDLQQDRMDATWSIR